jgi:hypothetical protein
VGFWTRLRLERCRALTIAASNPTFWKSRVAVISREIDLSSIDNHGLKLISSKQPDRFIARYFMDEATDLEDSAQLVRDWQNLSESSLAEVWLNEEEDKAWQDL